MRSRASRINAPNSERIMRSTVTPKRAKTAVMNRDERVG